MRMSRRDISYLTREEALEQIAPSRFALITAVATVALVIASVAWSGYVSVTSVAVSKGEIIPSGDERVVQHLEGGIIQQINVSDGSLVEKGAVLLTFDPTLRQAELDQIRAREAALTIRERKLRALIDGRESIDYSDLQDEYPELVEEALVSVQATRERVNGRIAVLQAQIEQRERTVDIFKQQAASLNDQYKLVTEVAEMREDLFKKGHGSRVNLIGARLEQSKVQGSLTEARVSQEQAGISIEEARNQIKELKLNERSTAMEELSDVLAELAEVRQNLERLGDRVKRLSVVSPVAGVVHRLQVNTPGEVVESADVLMTIVPLDEEVVVETSIEPKDIGHLKIGQPAKVTVSGFDARRYGIVSGVLTQISPTTYSNEKGEAYFKGRIVLDSDTISAGDVTHRIVPGMTVQADIAIGEQTLLEYLTRPVYVALTKAFTER